MMRAAGAETCRLFSGASLQQHRRGWGRRPGRGLRGPVRPVRRRRCRRQAHATRSVQWPGLWYPTWFRLQNEEEILAVLLAVLGAVSAGGIAYAPADTAAGMVHGLVALAVLFLVFNPASSRHYRTSMRNRSSLA